jgi:GT2 family glycosyltransferase
MTLNASSTSGLWTAFGRSDEGGFLGFVVDPDNLCQRFVVEILVDGHPVRVLRSDARSQQLINEHVGDGCYGFSCTLKVIGDGTVVEARLANVGTPVGAPIALSDCAEEISQGSSESSIRWLGGLRFTGWFAGDLAEPTGEIVVDGTLVTRVRASTWNHVGTPDGGSCAVRTFNFHLPEKFADGRAHRLIVVDGAGKDIGGGPLSFIAYADGFRETTASLGLSEQEQLRAQLLDRLLPMSVPFSDYQRWKECLPTFCGSPVPLTGAVIMVGSGATEETLTSLNVQTHNEWVAASLPRTQDPLGLRPELAQEFLTGEGADCDFIVFALAGTIFGASALHRIANAFIEFPEAQVVYADVDLQSEDGSIWPLAFPAFDYERMLEQGYCAYLFAMRRSASQLSLAAGASSLYRVFNFVLDDATISNNNIVHLPGPLATLPQIDKKGASAALTAATCAHLQQKEVEARAASHAEGLLPSVHITRIYHHESATVIIPTRNRQHLLRSCLESIRPAVERLGAHIMVVDSDSSDPGTLSYLTEIERCTETVLRVSGEFSFPRLINCAVEAAQSEVVCILDDAVKASDELWLDEMLGRIAQRDVGAVGAQLIWPSGVVQHGGIVLGSSFATARAFNDRIVTDVGYGDLLRVAHECSAVSAACLVTKRRDFLAVGGMDEVRFPVNFSDVDYCLKLRAAGKRIVFTPHAKLVHTDAASCRANLKAEQEIHFERELRSLRAKWGSVIAADPYYSPMLSRDPIPFSALAWPAQSMEPRVNYRPVPLHVPHGF